VHLAEADGLAAELRLALATHRVLQRVTIAGEAPADQAVVTGGALRSRSQVIEIRSAHTR
jgi:hypothetical protein